MVEYRVTVTDIEDQKEILTELSFPTIEAAYEMVYWHRDMVEHRNIEILLERIGDNYACLYMQKSNRL
jgi:hypothetical protein